MEDSDDHELALLRARAYGPDADIHTDTRALARLRELERAPQVRVGGNGAPPPMAPAVPVPPLPETPAAVAAATPVAGAARFSPRTRLLAACAATALAAIAIAVPVTLWASADRPYAVLHATDEDPSPMFSGGGETAAVRYEDFFGIKVTVGTLDYREGRCILIEPEVDDFAYMTPGACSPPGLDPVVDVGTVDMRLSDEARAVLGDASALRFAVAGEDVHVFVVTAPDDDSVARS